MTLKAIRWHIRSGLYNEARKLIEKEQTVESLMIDTERSDNADSDNLPLLVMISLIKDEENALSLSRLLIEKGYHAELSDRNGLCALNYAIALQRTKIITFLLNSFHFELHNYRDCYKNTFFHYVYATDNFQLIQQFTKIYSKYYPFGDNLFKKLVNCDGLSVQDLRDYFDHMKKRKNSRKLRLSRTNSVANLKEENVEYRLPESFKCNSNPIVICNYINHVFNSHSTIKTDLVFVANNTQYVGGAHKMTKQKLYMSNQASKEFKLNILHQIKSLNKPSGAKVSSAYLSEKMKRNKILNLRRLNHSSLSNPENSTEKYAKYSWNYTNEDEADYQYYKFENPFGAKGPSTWRTDISFLFDDYSIINSPSYRASSAMVLKMLGKDPNAINMNPENGDPSKNSEANQANTGSTNTSLAVNNLLSNSKLTGLGSNGRAGLTNSPLGERKVKSPHQQTAKLDTYLIPNSFLSAKTKK
ncbi:hypothetical protein BpHYR1_004937 [Brachionus plicatilis]|uniref:Uncharacterized protein n=1 Tax=Brachionus plicatilis TaxID=10195 RepID=A0A3M7S1C9_BRAPC|nr:hypothetical protein BpHYR1_004937 [Brachionus plicatilis]